MNKIVIILNILFYLKYNQASFNIFIQEDDVNKFVGIFGELYYVREGHLNTNALNWLLIMPAQINDLQIKWQSLIGRPIYYNYEYSLIADLNENDAFKINITETGTIPISLDTIQVELSCSKNTEIILRLNFNVTYHRLTNNFTTFHILFKKICMQTIPYQINNDAIIVKSQLQPINLFFVANLTTLLIILTTIMFISFYYLSEKKKNMLKKNLNFILKRREVQDETRGESVVDDTNIDSREIESRNENNREQSQLLIDMLNDGSYENFKLTRRQLKEREQKDLKEKLDQIPIESCRVRLNNVIMEGSFGRVYLGTYKNPQTNQEEDIYIKTVTDQATDNQKLLLIIESLQMFKLQHQNILPVKGISLNNSYVIYNYDGYKNLKKFFLKYQSGGTGQGGERLIRKLTTQCIIEMILEVVNGMIYLHQCLIIHKDLAARNCVVDDDLNIKITDNSLAIDMFPGDYHCLCDNDSRPIKWLAIECLEFNASLFQSDIWSFGVLLWEFMTLCQQPYQEIDPFEMEAYLKDGYRLPQPINCPDELFALMAYCWNLKSEERPSFNQLKVCLEEFKQQLNKYV